MLHQKIALSVMWYGICLKNITLWAEQVDGELNHETNEKA